MLVGRQLIKALSDIMGLLDSIKQLEEKEDVERCCKCREYRLWDSGGHCELYECSCDPDDAACCDFKFSEFWETKRGY